MIASRFPKTWKQTKTTKRKRRARQNVPDLTTRDASRIEWIREQIVKQYRNHPTGSGGTFDELLCHELHHGHKKGGGLTFCWLARKWGISLPTLGKLIADHCERLEGPHVDHKYCGPV